MEFLKVGDTFLLKIKTDQGYCRAGGGGGVLTIAVLVRYLQRRNTLKEEKDGKFEEEDERNSGRADWGVGRLGQKEL